MIDKTEGQVHRGGSIYRSVKNEFFRENRTNIYGPVVVELKLLHNAEIQNKSKRTAYKMKLEKYLKANSGLGIYIVFQTKDIKSHPIKFQEMVSEYADLNGLNCLLLKC